MPNYENKFVQDTEEAPGDTRVAFRLKQAEYTEQPGDVLFLSPIYPNCVLEGKKKKARKDKSLDSSYNTYYFDERCKEQYKTTQEFALNAGLVFLYFFYVTFGRGHPAEFHVIPAKHFEGEIKSDGPAKMTVQQIRWNSLDDPWFEHVA